MNFWLMGWLFVITVITHAEVVDKLSCGTKNIEIKSDCQDRLTRMCKDQTMVVDSKTISLMDPIDRAMWVESWGCANSKKGNYLILSFNNGGNCDQCETFRIFDLKGKQLSKSPNEYSKIYKKLGIIKTSVKMLDLNIFP